MSKTNSHEDRCRRAAKATGRDPATVKAVMESFFAQTRYYLTHPKEAIGGVVWRGFLTLKIRGYALGQRLKRRPDSFAGDQKDLAEEVLSRFNK